MADYILYYCSADGPGPAPTWSVYRERYVDRDAPEPIDGSQELVSSGHANEDTARFVAHELQAAANLPDNDDGYTTEPTHVRIFVEEGGMHYDSDGNPTEGNCLTIDGADDDGRYTEAVWSGYRTVEDAAADVAGFVAATTIDGYRWHWNPDRPKGLRRAPLWGYGGEDTTTTPQEG